MRVISNSNITALILCCEGKQYMPLHAFQQCSTVFNSSSWTSELESSSLPLSSLKEYDSLVELSLLHLDFAASKECIVLVELETVLTDEQLKSFVKTYFPAATMIFVCLLRMVWLVYIRNWCALKVNLTNASNARYKQEQHNCTHSVLWR